MGGVALRHPTMRLPVKPEYVAHIAFDLLAQANVDVDVLAEDERGPYLLAQAERLEPLLSRLVYDFVATEMQPVEEWRRVRRANTAD